MKPNILFIMTDQQRFDTVCDQPVVRYPRMQRFRSESVSFDHFFVAATACVPSRATFLFGRNAWDLRIRGNSRFMMDQTQCGPLDISWMQVLRDQGYASFSVGKTHMIHAGSYHIPVPLERSFGDKDGWDHFHPEPSQQPDDTFYDIHVARRSCDALERVKGRGPFAMFVGFHAPHEPYVLPEKYLGFCRPQDVQLPGNRSLDEYATKSESYRRRVEHFRSMFGDCITDDEAIRRGIAAYYSSLKMVDDCVGMILDKLEDLGLDRNTVVVFTSDHGELLGEHYLFNKNATAYDGETHIPFMIRFPDRKHAGKQVSHLACALDAFPTLMEILGVDPDLPLPGYSLMPAISEGKEVREDVLIFHAESSMTLLWQGAKLTYCPEDEDGELYDLKTDPEEMRNLWSSPSHQELKEKMLLRMLHRRMVQDKLSSLLTLRERRLHTEVYASKEPEVVQ